MAKVNFIQKNKKPIIIAGGVIVGLILLLVVVKAVKKKSDSDLPENVDAPKTGIAWPLKRKAGALTNSEEQQAIKQVQNYLNRKIYGFREPLNVDGYFGTETEGVSQQVLGVKTVSYSLYQEIIGG